MKGLSRHLKDTITNRHTDTKLSPEEARMADKLRRSKQYEQSNVTAIKNVRMTVGEVEEEDMKQENEVLSKRGLPVYIRTSTSLGSKVYLWSQHTTNIKEFITSIEFGHKNPLNKKHKSPETMVKDNWILVGHNLVDLQIWIKRDISCVSSLSNKFSISNMLNCMLLLELWYCRSTNNLFRKGRDTTDG
jgi:hypothetical protein